MHRARKESLRYDPQQEPMDRACSLVGWNGGPLVGERAAVLARYLPLRGDL